MKNKFVSIISIVLLSFLLLGCASDSQQKEVEDMAITGESAEVTVEDETKLVDESGSKTESSDENFEEKNNAVAETTESPVAEADLIVSDIYEFLDYAESLGDPAILIYNENEGYVINMGEGEYYQLKSDDRIFGYDTERAIRTSNTLKGGVGTTVRGYVYELEPDYSVYDKPHEAILAVSYTGEWENEQDYFVLTCYLNAPVE